MGKVLVACEESQVVTIAFRNLGHEAYSCDIQDCSGGHPEWHIKDDVLRHLEDGWDLMIAHPPCTHLACSGARWFKYKKEDGRQREGIDFFVKLTQSNIDKWSIENPIGIMSKIFRKPDQIIQPYYFGDEFQKTTCLWLKNLPKLVHQKEDNLFYNKTHVSKGDFVISKSGTKMSKWYADLWNDKDRQKKRSVTFPGIARAMAEQWGKLI